MNPRLATLARVVLSVAAITCATGCKKKHGGGAPVSVTGAGRSTDPAGVLLLQVYPNDDVAWFFAAGGGSCVFLAEGTIDEDAGVLVSEFDEEFPYEIVGDVLEVTDPDDNFGGSFEKVDVN